MTDQQKEDQRLEPLDDRLRLYVGEGSASAAAVNLLIAHRTWLARADFLNAFTFTCTDFDTNVTSTGIEWDQAIAALNQGRLPCSPSEAKVLRISASLARGIPVDLGNAVTSLDRINTRRIVDAVRQAAGHAV